MESNLVFLLLGEIFSPIPSYSVKKISHKINIMNDSIMLNTISGGQSGTAVKHPHGNHQDVGSNPAAARNQKN